MNDSIPKQTSLWYALLGVPFLLAGAGFSVYNSIHGLTHLTESLTQIIVPGKAHLDLKSGPTYTVFSEEQSVVNGKIYSTTESIGGLECIVRSVPNGIAVPVGQPSVSTTYTVGGRSGRSVLQFSVPGDGKYEFSCEYGQNARVRPETVLAVGTSVGAKILRSGVVSAGAIFAGVGLFLAVMLTVVARRSRYTKAQYRAGSNQ